MNFNWVDWVILSVIVYHALLGWQAGFFPLITSFVSFIAAVWAAIFWQTPVSAFLTEKFGVAASWSIVLSYVFIAFVVQEVVSEVMHVLIGRVPKKIQTSKIAEWLGAVVSALNGLIIISFFLLIILALPLRGTVKTDITTSKIGGFLTRYIQVHGGPIQSAAREVGEGARKFFTVEPASKESMTLDVAPKSSDLRVDAEAEAQMLKLVNAERAKVGAPALVVDPKIVPVARAYSRDMFERRYFSHYSPEGEDAADRMQKGGVTFSAAGENLAYAPDMKAAHDGLLESPGHKRNILDPQFHRIGIGIIATDSFGIMVTQNFAD
jgi:uncharacterized protein YkwD/uncharacterized membrane protein required for colicin V production